LWWITTHSDTIYNILWGDKDTYMLAFAAAGKAASYAQMPIPPAAALSGKSGEFHHLMAMVQHDHYGRQAWVHNTLNKHGLWAQGPPALYTLVTGPMPEWVGSRLSDHPNIFTMNATRLVPLQVEQPVAATNMVTCPHAVLAQFLRVQALGLALLPQPWLMAACSKELSQLLENAASNSSSSREGVASGRYSLRQLHARQLQQESADACMQVPRAAGHLEQLLQQQVAQQQLGPVQWASVLVGRAAADELVHALSAPANTPAGVAQHEREDLAQWLAAAHTPDVLQYLNWHLMAVKKAPAACTAAGPGRVANADGAMPVLQLRHPGSSSGGAQSGSPAAWSALELAQVVWLPEAVKWIQETELIKKHV
jgi:hypothetical protein